MKDFAGKLIKIYFNTNQGFSCMSGNFVRYEDGFYIIKDSVANKIRYLNKDYIRMIEIIGDSGADE